MGHSLEVDYSFKNQDLLREALTHSSITSRKTRAKNEKSLLEKNNERLEFIGDSVINLCLTRVLWDRFPNLSEGELSRFRSGLVSRQGLARLARSINLGQHILLARSEKQNAAETKDRILANTFEALVGAIYIDSNFQTAETVIKKILTEDLLAACLKDSEEDYKSKFQIEVQKKSGETPIYHTVLMEGPDHKRVITVSVSVAGEVLVKAEGPSKKIAAQKAAKKALKIWGER